MLRVSDDPPRQQAGEQQDQSSAPAATTSSNPPPTYLTVDKKKRQVTLTETHSSATMAPSERGPMVSAPKMFAFDALFTTEDSQVCSMGWFRTVVVCIGAVYQNPDRRNLIN